MVSIFAFTFLSILISFSVGGLSSGNGIGDLLYSNLSLRLMCVNNGKMYSSGGGFRLGFAGFAFSQVFGFVWFWFWFLVGFGFRFGFTQVSVYDLVPL